MALFPQLDDNALYIARKDDNEILGSHRLRAFYLDDAEWPSIAHYFHAMKFQPGAWRDKIRLAATADEASRLGRSRLHRIRRDWRAVRVTVMTRAVYISCKTHADMAEALLATGERTIIDNNNYDYFWGCGRDRRGENQYGKVLMKVRNKLAEEQQA